MLFNRVDDFKEEKFVPLHFLTMPIDLTDGVSDEGSDFSGSDDEHENQSESDTEETSDENSSEPQNASKSSNGDSDIAKDDERTIPENRFLTALMNAAQSYSKSLRVTVTSKPAVSSVSSRSPLTAVAPPSSLLELADDDDAEMEDFSDDEDCDDKLLPSLSVEESNQLFYKPVGKWADFAECPIENPVVVSKLHSGAMCDASIKQGILGRRKITYISKTWSFSHRWEGFFSEMMLYADPSYLRPLQGKVVPEIIGLYLVDGAISVAMELPSSTFWVEASEDMSDLLKHKCIAAFDEIHARGVLHNDVELRHMLVSAASEVTIIDFQMSRALKPNYDVGLQRAIEDELRLEKRKVRFKLDYDNAQRKENIKRTRVLTRRQRNLERKRRRKQLPPGTEISLEDEYEQDDEDDIINPTVGDVEWLELWVGDEFDPSCYVVPGQDELKVDAMLKEFVTQEIARLEEEEKEKQEQPPAAQANKCPGASRSHHRPTGTQSLSSSTASSSQTIMAPMSSESPRSEVLKDNNKDQKDMNTSSSRGPAHPMRVSSTPSRGIKRPRGSTEDNETSDSDGNDDTVRRDSDLEPPPKKRITDVVASAVKDDGLTTSARTRAAAATPASSAPSTSPLSTSTTTTESQLPELFESTTSSSLTPSTLSPVSSLLEECKWINVPYDNYTGPKGGKLRNVFSDKELSDWRRHWIRLDNMRQFREEGVIHPNDELFKDVMVRVETDSDEVVDSSDKANEGKKGKKRKRKGTMQRGSLKRYKREMDAPGKAKRAAFKRKEQYFRDRALQLGWKCEDDDDAFSDSDDEEEPGTKNFSGNEWKQEAGDDGIPEGPRILTWAELEARKAEAADGHSISHAAAPVSAFALSSGPVGSSSAPPSISPSSVPRRSILRRQLTAEEKFKQRAFEETLTILGQHPNQLNSIHGRDVDGTPPASSAPKASLQVAKSNPLQCPNQNELSPLPRPYTEAREVMPASATVPSMKEQPRVAIQLPTYASATPPSAMFAPRMEGSAGSALTKTRKGSISTISLARKRAPRTPAAAFCAFTGARAKFPPSPTRMSFPAPAATHSGTSRAFTVPHSSSPPSILSPFSTFPASSITTEASDTRSGSGSAQVPSASGSNVTLEDLDAGCGIEPESVSLEQARSDEVLTSATLRRQAPLPASIGAEIELISVEFAPNDDSHAMPGTDMIMQPEVVPSENNDFEAEEDAVEQQFDVDDDPDSVENISLSSRFLVLAKVVFPWFDRR